MTARPGDIEMVFGGIHRIATEMSPTDDNPISTLAGLAASAAVESSRPLCKG